MGISKLLYKTASNYVGVVDNVMAFASNATKVTWSCGSAVVCTVTNGYNKGIAGSIKETAKWCFGVNNYWDGWNSLKTQDIVTTNQNGNKHVLIKDTREYSQRIGDFGGHVLLGLAKAGITTSLALGEATKLAGTKYGIDSTIGLTQTMASAANTMVSAGCKIGATLLLGAASNAGKVLHYVVTHPIAAPQTALTAGRATGGMYLTCSEGVKAADAQGWKKAAHGLAAVTLGVGTVATAVLINYPIQTFQSNLNAIGNHPNVKYYLPF